MISIVVAYDRNRTIGHQGDIPWRGQLPADMAHFKELTMGGHVLMGRKTYESIPEQFRPLRNRVNYVVSTNSRYSKHNVVSVGNPHLMEDWKHERDAELFVIGGAQIYEHFLKWTARIYATEIEAEFDCDVSFPELEVGSWVETSREDHPVDEANAFPYAFVTYERKRDWDE